MVTGCIYHTPGIHGWTKGVGDCIFTDIPFNIFIQNNAVYCMASTKNDKLKERKQKKSDNIIYSSIL